jgi:hypothetical protein
MGRPGETARKQMLTTIQSWVLENPNRKRTVLPIEIRVLSDTQEGEEAPATLPGGWVPTPLEPPGPVSQWLWKTNAEYRAGTAQMRRTILRDALLEIGARVDAELRGAKWSRKKIHEQLAAQQTAAVSPPMDTPELDKGLAALIGVQIVQVDEANKKVRFVPPDPRTWSAELPVWGATTGARAVLHRQNEESVGEGLAKWLGDRESEGWKIAWPEADGTIEELKSKLAQRGLSVGGGGTRLDKPKKADYAAALGRAEAVSHLSTLSRAR